MGLSMSRHRSCLHRTTRCQVGMYIPKPVAYYCIARKPQYETQPKSGVMLTPGGSASYVNLSGENYLELQ